MTTAIICIFIVGYIMIAMENVTKVNKSAVALLKAVLCWTLLYLGLGHRATDKVEDFCGDFLLAAFVVGQGELGDEVLGVV